jgi:hypothetical protein
VLLFNHQLKIRRVISTLLSLMIIIGLVPSQLVSADANKLYITPDSSQMNTGTSFTVNVRSYSSTSPTTGTVKGSVLYTTSLLAVSSISIAGSAYGSPAITQTSGTVTFNGSRSPSPSGTAQIFSITFKTLGAGTATVGFNGNSVLNGLTTTYSGGTYAITNPAPTPSSPSPSSSSSSSSGSSSGTKPGSSGSTYHYTYTPAPIVSTAPTVTPITAVNADTAPAPTPDPTGVVDSVIATPTYNSATVTWKVNATSPNTSLVYGTSSTELNKNAVVEKKADGSFATHITGLTPGQEYFYSITGSGSNVTAGTYSSTIPVLGYPVVISVTENNVIANNVQVQIGSLNLVTHSDGKIAAGLAAGSYSGKITSETATLNINLTVTDKPIPTDGSPPEAQTLSYNLTSSTLSAGPGAGTTILTFVGVLFGGGVIIVFGFLIFINYRRRKFDSGTDSYAISSGPSVVIKDDYSWAPPDSQQSSGPPLPPPTPVVTTPYAPPNQSVHSNSVHLSEEEPLDMFEQAKVNQTGTNVPGSSTGQNPS